jgi:hypothetical protein
MPKIKFTCEICGEVEELHFPVGGVPPNYPKIDHWAFCYTCYYNVIYDMGEIIKNRKKLYLASKK